MIILAIDPGCLTGIALSNKKSETVDFRKYDDIAGASCKFQKILPDYFQKNNIQQLIIERPFFQRHSKDTDLTNALIWGAHFIAYLKNISRTELTANQARKNLIGRARKKSDEPVKAFDKIICSAVKKEGFNPHSEHEADAAALIVAYARMNNLNLASMSKE